MPARAVLTEKGQDRYMGCRSPRELTFETYFCGRFKNHAVAAYVWGQHAGEPGRYTTLMGSDFVSAESRDGGAVIGAACPARTPVWCRSFSRYIRTPARVTAATKRTPP